MDTTYTTAITKLARTSVGADSSAHVLSPQHIIRQPKSFINSTGGQSMTIDAPHPPIVFISYSHDSPEHCDCVLALSDRLRNNGIDCTLDQYIDSPPEGWPRWMDRQIRAADFVLMICTPTYYRLSTAIGYEELYRRLTYQPGTLKPILGELKQLAPRERAAELRLTRTHRVANERPNNYVPFPRNPLFQPRPGEFEHLETILFGLDTEQQPARLGLVGVVGMGGVGKTQLAVELAYRCLDQQRYPAGTFWMPATGTSVFDWQRQFAELAFSTDYLPPIKSGE